MTTNARMRMSAVYVDLTITAHAMPNRSLANAGILVLLRLGAR